MPTLYEWRLSLSQFFSLLTHATHRYKNRYFTTRSPALFPFCTTVDVQLRVAVLKFVGEMAKYVPEEQSQAVSHNVYVNLFLRSLTSRNEAVKKEVTRVLGSNILCVENNILNLESLIKHCLIPMMDSVANLEYVSPTLLDGLMALLDLVDEKVGDSAS